jgi:hypothetical protein
MEEGFSAHDPLCLNNSWVGYTTQTHIVILNDAFAVERFAVLDHEPIVPIVLAPKRPSW